MSNMRQLVVAWMAYAENNDGKIVNGGQHPVPITDAANASTEPYWCTGFHTDADRGFDWNIGGSWGGNEYCTSGTPVLTYDQRVEKLKKGALYRYVKNTKVYRCSEAPKFVHRTYVMPNSMNAHDSSATLADPKAEGEVFKRTGQIKGSAQRLVFIEEKIVTPDAMQILANVAQWEPYPDWPGLMHEKGTTVGFADGHGEYWRWQCQETVALAALVGLPPNYKTYTQPTCKKDIVKVQVAVWGNSLQYHPAASDMP